MSFYQRFSEYLQNRYPLWSNTRIPLSPQLISPHILRLPRSILLQIQKGVSAFEQLPLTELIPSQLQKFDPGNRAILMSYDCHVTEDGTPKLIEINTNASFGLIGDALTDFQNVAHESFVTALRQDIENEWRLFGLTQTPHIAVVDTDPEKQKLFAEFVLYKNLFESWGWSCEIANSHDLTFTNNELRSPNGPPIGFIYNRDTDFYLNEHAALREAYFQHAVCLSPHPREYALFADKKRLIEVAQFGEDVTPELRKTIASFVPQALDLKDFPDREEIWARRKHFVFKPKTAFGSKAVYRGSSISKKTFLEVVTDDFIAQEFVPAAEVQFEGAEPFKYDLRSYVYNGEVRLTMARLYRGQVTNFNEINGGFAAVEFY